MAEPNNKIVKGKIANALTSAAKNHIVATTDDIFDVELEKYQDDINKTVSNNIETLQTNVETSDEKINTIQDDVNTLNVKTDETNERVDNAENVINSINDDLSAIKEKIPEEASDTNQLADKQYVEDTITATATDLIDTKLIPLDTRIGDVEDAVSNIEPFTPSTIVPTTTNFVPGTDYTIHESLQRTANLFAGVQNEIDDINAKIPAQASSQNQLADKNFVNSTVATNAANFRGNWVTWNHVPTVANNYPEDYAGNRTPTNNDYMVVQDVTGYIIPNEHVTLHRTMSSNNLTVTVTITNTYGATGQWTLNYPYAGMNVWVRYDDRIEFYQVPGGAFLTYVRFSMDVTYNNVIYRAGTSISLIQNRDMQFNYGTELSGQWRFMYVGDWDTLGKSGWQAQYKVGSSFTAAQQAALDSNITAQKVATYDGYGNSISALQTDKVDKVYTANKIYATDGQGQQTALGLGQGLYFGDNNINMDTTDIAKESTLTQGISDIRNDMSNIDVIIAGNVAKQGTNPNANITDIQNFLSPIATELESGKSAIVAAINAMGGQADSSMSLGELADAVRTLILVQLGELEYDIPIESCEEALNLASTHCTKYVNDYTTNMYTPLIVDEWQAVEEVRYKKLIKYDYALFSSDERKSGVFALTLCHNLRQITFDLLQSITIQDATSQFASSLVSLQEITMPSLKTISVVGGANSNTAQVFHNLPSLISISLPNIETIISNTDSSDSSNQSRVFTNLSSVTILSLPKLERLECRARNYTSSAQMFSGLSSLTSLSLPALQVIETGTVSSSPANSAQVFSGLSSLISLSLPSITRINVRVSQYQIFTGAINLEYIEIGYTDDFGVGSIVDDMRLNNINPTNTYQDATKLAALNQSIKTKWFANLYDYTGGAAHTLTLATAFVNHLEQETIDVATAKNWTIQTV